MATAACQHNKRGTAHRVARARARVDTQNIRTTVTHKAKHTTSTTCHNDSDKFKTYDAKRKRARGGDSAQHTAPLRARAHTHTDTCRTATTKKSITTRPRKQRIPRMTVRECVSCVCGVCGVCGVSVCGVSTGFCAGSTRRARPPLRQMGVDDSKGRCVNERQPLRRSAATAARARARHTLDSCLGFCRALSDRRVRRVCSLSALVRRTVLYKIAPLKVKNATVLKGKDLVRRRAVHARTHARASRAVRSRV